MKNLPPVLSLLLVLGFSVMAAQPALAGYYGSASGDDRHPANWDKPQSGHHQSKNRRSDDDGHHGSRDKADICHVPPGNPGNAHRIRVGSPAKNAHYRHGDPGGHEDLDHDCRDKPDDDDGGHGHDKVTICHIPPGNPGNAHDITIGKAALEAHLAHGDSLGACDTGGGECRVVKPKRAWWKSLKLGGVQQYRQCLSDCKAPVHDNGKSDRRDGNGDGRVSGMERKQCRLDCAQLPPPLPPIGDDSDDLRQCIEDCRIGDASVWSFNRKGKVKKRLVKRCVARCQKDICDDQGNHPPVADAGADQSIALATEATLDGSASSDADGDPLTYRWTVALLPPGSAAFLSDTGAVMPTFVADVEGEYRFDLVVNDGEFDSDPDQVSVFTYLQNTPPQADAGLDQSLRVGETAFLDGSGSSDADGDPLSYDWSLVSAPPGSSASLSDASAVMPEFVIDLPGQYVLELVVDDGEAASEPDTVVVSTINTRPLADAGLDVTVAVGQTVTLSGAGSSDAEGDPLGFAWSLSARPNGSSAVLTGTDSVEPELVTDLVGVYVAQLIVNDGQLDSLPDTVVITAVDNQSPTAVLDLLDLGGAPLPNNQVPIRDDFLLDGSQSFDPEGEIVSYTWTYLETGVSVETEDPFIPASLLVDVETLPLGQHEFQLQVTDSSGNLSEPSMATVTVFDPYPPTAVLTPLDAAGQPLVGGNVPAGEDFILDGSESSDGEGDIVAYRWTHVESGLSVVTAFPTINVSQLVGDLELDGNETFLLQVTDDSGNQSDPDQAVVNVVGDQPPVALAQALDQAGFPVPPGGFVVFQTPFSLDGSESFDIGGAVVRYAWTWLDTGDEIATDQPTIDSALLVGTDFLPIGQYQFELVVTDDTGNESDPVSLSVSIDREPD